MPRTKRRRRRRRHLWNCRRRHLWNWWDGRRRRAAAFPERGSRLPLVFLQESARAETAARRSVALMRVRRYSSGGGRSATWPCLARFPLSDPLSLCHAVSSLVPHLTDIQCIASYAFLHGCWIRCRRRCWPSSAPAWGSSRAAGVVAVTGCIVRGGAFALVLSSWGDAGPAGAE